MDSNQILQKLVSEIENSSLNYKISKTPFSATISLKSSFVKHMGEALRETKVEYNTKQENVGVEKRQEAVNKKSKDENELVRKVEELEQKIEALQGNLKTANKNKDRLEDLLREEKSKVEKSDNLTAEFRAELLKVKSEKKALSATNRSLESEANGIKDENDNLKELVSEKQKVSQVLKNEVNLSVNERKLLERKLSESASEIDSLKQKCRLQCDNYGENVEKLIKLQEHKLIHHMKDRETKHNSSTNTPVQQFQEYKCFYCDKAIKTEALLEMHKNACHESFLCDFQCFDCGSKRTSKIDLDWHKTTVHGPFAPKQSETHLPIIPHYPIEREQCDFCDMKFITLGALRNHIRCQHKEILPS
jgi:DNA repair exonuclease SbcCD ATPase subunit